MFTLLKYKLLAVMSSADIKKTATFLGLRLEVG